MNKNSFLLALGIAIMGTTTHTSEKNQIIQNENQLINDDAVVSCLVRLFIDMGHLEQLQSELATLNEQQQTLKLRMLACNIKNDTITQATEKIIRNIQEGKNTDDIINTLSNDSTLQSVKKFIKPLTELLTKMYTLLEVAASLDQELQQIGGELEEFKNNLMKQGHSEQQAVEILEDCMKAVQKNIASYLEEAEKETAKQ